MKNTLIYNGTIHPDISVTIHDSNGPIYDTDEESEDQEDDVGEVGQPETEGLEDEDEGMFTGWIIAGVVLGLSLIGGIIFAMMRRNQ